MKILLLSLFVLVQAFPQEYIVDRFEDVTFNEKSISIVSKREELVLFYDKLLIIKSEDSRNKNGYSDFVFSDHVIRVLERAHGFEAIRQNKMLGNLVLVQDKRNKNSQYLINKNKISSLKVEKITQVRFLVRLQLEGLGEVFECEGDQALVDSLSK